MGYTENDFVNADPLFNQSQTAGLVHSYPANHDALDPLASPLYADLKGLVPIRLHVGDDEVLLDDSVRFIAQAVTAEVDARLDVKTVIKFYVTVV
jgi:epsilon-lactone hydrolase